MSLAKTESSPRFATTLEEQGLLPVLLVDDDVGLAKVVKQCLETEGTFRIVTASNVSEAVGKLNENKFDVVVSDYEMPGENGLDFLRKIRQAGNRIPFILFTGKGREEVAVEALNLGADQYLNKGGDPETVFGELSHAIKKAARAKRAEYALYESEKKYRQLVENLQEGIWVFDRDGFTSFANPRMVEMLGYTAAEMLKEHLFSFMDEKNATIFKQTFFQLSNGVKQQIELELIKKDGGRLFVALKTAPIMDQDGNCRETIMGVVDITQRKEMEEGIRQELRMLETVTHNIDAGLAIISRDYCTVWANKVLKDTFGAIEQRPCYLAYNQREEICLGCGVKEIFSGKRSRIVHEQTGKNIRGESVQLEIVATPIKDNEGNITAALELILPMTSQKKAEQALHEAKKSSEF
jgi:PAS domain S-box-containing protein